MQLIGECVGLVMAPVIFYYLYYQVKHAMHHLHMPMQHWTCLHHVQFSASCCVFGSGCLPTAHGMAVRFAVCASCCSVAGPMTAGFAPHDTCYEKLVLYHMTPAVKEP